MHHVAGKRSCLETMKWLKEQGADVNVKSEAGRTPMHNAALYGHFEIVKWLKEQGADVNVKGNDGKTPLDLASSIHEANGSPARTETINFLKANVSVTEK